MAPPSDDVREIPAVKQSAKHSQSWLRILGFGVVLLGIAACINAVDDWVDSRNSDKQEATLNRRIEILNDQFTCRYIISQRSQELQSNMTLELSLGLAAFAAEDEEGLRSHTQRINEIAPELQVALEERSEAGRVCDNPRE